uniref:Secreted protein n=1 Tax=Arundo donax TaxID=35708 RepID=A0A0A8YXY5_ARUDO
MVSVSLIYIVLFSLLVVSSVDVIPGDSPVRLLHRSTIWSQHAMLEASDSVSLNNVTASAVMKCLCFSMCYSWH